MAASARAIPGVVTSGRTAKVRMNRRALLRRQNTAAARRPRKAAASYRRGRS